MKMMAIICQDGITSLGIRMRKYMSICHGLRHGSPRLDIASFASIVSVASRRTVALSGGDCEVDLRQQRMNLNGRSGQLVHAANAARPWT